MRNTHISVSNKALQHNLGVVKNIAPSAKVLAMVKANAYGHGIAFAVHNLKDADGLGVASMQEAYQVIDAGLLPHQQLVLIEGVFSEQEWQEVVKLSKQHHIGVVIHNTQQLAWALAEPAPHIPIWLKINTGMFRLGMDVTTAFFAAQQLLAVDYPIILTTHFANADEPEHPLNTQQMESFLTLKKQIEEATNTQIAASACNSAALIHFPQWHFDWVRPGIMLYGSQPFNSDLTHSEVHQHPLIQDQLIQHELTQNTLSNTHAQKSLAVIKALIPVMTLSASLIAIQSVAKGDAVGYGSTWQASRPSTIGIVSIGYGDGYPRVVNNAQVFMLGQKRPVIGRVSMDMLMIDLTDIPTPPLNTAVELWGNNINVNDVALAANTISYELLCRLTNRPNRHIVA